MVSGTPTAKLQFPEPALFTAVEGDLPTSFEIPAATLAQMNDRTRFAISTEETRYYLNGTPDFRL